MTCLVPLVLPLCSPISSALLIGRAHKKVRSVADSVQPTALKALLGLAYAQCVGEAKLRCQLRKISSRWSHRTIVLLLGTIVIGVIITKKWIVHNRSLHAIDVALLCKGAFLHYRVNISLSMSILRAPDEEHLERCDTLHLFVSSLTHSVPCLKYRSQCPTCVRFSRVSLQSCLLRHLCPI